jgi:hypothetical protein
MANNIIAINPRPDREETYLNMFGRWWAWRIFARGSSAVYGTTPRTSNGMVECTRITDLLNSVAAVEDPGSAVSTAAGVVSGGGTVTCINGQLYFLPPPLVAMTVPAQTACAKLTIGMYTSANNTPILAGATVDLVKIAADGTITQLGTGAGTIVGSNAATAATTWTPLRVTANIAIAADSAIAATERLSVRLTTTTSSSSATANNVSMTLNAGGGSSLNAPTLATTTSDIILEVR